jgi:hypothetical protein
MGLPMARSLGRKGLKFASASASTNSMGAASAAIAAVPMKGSVDKPIDIHWMAWRRSGSTPWSLCAQPQQEEEELTFFMLIVVME